MRDTGERVKSTYPVRSSREQTFFTCCATLAGQLQQPGGREYNRTHTNGRPALRCVASRAARSSSSEAGRRLRPAQQRSGPAELSCSSALSSTVHSRSRWESRHEPAGARTRIQVSPEPGTRDQGWIQRVPRALTLRPSERFHQNTTISIRPSPCEAPMKTSHQTRESFLTCAPHGSHDLSARASTAHVAEEHAEFALTLAWRCVQQKGRDQRFLILRWSKRLCPLSSSVRGPPVGRLLHLLVPLPDPAWHNFRQTRRNFRQT